MQISIYPLTYHLLGRYRALPSVFLPLLFEASQQLTQGPTAHVSEINLRGQPATVQTERLWTHLVPSPSTFFPLLFTVSKQFAVEAVVPFFEANTWVVSSTL
jgi:hypothetical protein